MARLYPFRATRFNPARVSLADGVVQPRSRRTPSLQQSYYACHPYNLVRIVQGLPELFDAPGGETVWTRAARDFAEWRRNGVLLEDPEPAIFAYSQRYRSPGDGRPAERRGFIALGEVREYSDQVIFPHQETPLRPDPYCASLFAATRAQFEQILMLYSDPACTADRLLEAAAAQPDAILTDESGVEHRLTRVSDQATIKLLISAMEDRKLILAEGADVYDAALATRRRELAEGGARRESERAAASLPEPPSPRAAAMMTFVNMDAGDLSIAAVHRLLRGMPAFDAAALLARAGECFLVTPLGQGTTESLLAPLGRRQGPALVVVTPAGAWLLAARPEAIARELAGCAERLRRLEVVLLHALILERLLGIGPASAGGRAQVVPEPDPAQAVEQVRSGGADAAFLLPPVGLRDLREVAFAGDVLPRGSTAFYPPLLEGLTIYAQD